MTNDSQSRKWQLTINNPVDKGFTHDRIRAELASLKSIIYWCMADEIGENGTYHTHIYLQGKGAVRFSTIKKHFDGAHMEMGKGTALQNREYITKSGKWEQDKKHETCVEGTFEEWGELPVERQGSRNDLADLHAMIKEGLSDFDILEQMPEAMLQLSNIQLTRQVIVQEKYKSTWRDLTCSYIYGDTGTGKTRSIMEKYGYQNVYRVTDYLHPFDNYKGQDVIIFEEFRSSFRISDMLNYLDGYPLELPCRYANKYACYTKVYIISNIPLSEQYRNQPVESFHAFLRRIHSVLHYTLSGIKESVIEIHADGFRLLLPDEKIPFSSVRSSVIMEERK